ncbi:MAG: hypothetical protein K2J55_00655 [Eubacterium sp.]|nr:hypothetical protein [Eubacterium sp.]
MPFINTNTKVEISKEKEIALKTKLGKAIEILNKNESWLMISFDDKCSMYFKGEETPMAFVDISVFGQPNDAQCEEMTKEVCKIFEEELSIPADKLYVKYNGSTQWGWNNMNF